jgi:fructokinase
MSAVQQNSIQRQSVCVFGEVLFDHLPGGRRVLGGAPFNVAWHLSAFGLNPDFISCVGNDVEGDDVRRAMRNWGMALEGVRVDRALPTGRVHVALDSNGEPSYEIVDNCAYDAIATVPERRYALLYHGTLAVRQAQSAASLDALREHRHGHVFVDVNLRTPHWHRDSVLSLLKGADWVKLNMQELQLLAGGKHTTESNAQRMLEAYDLKGVLVTSGAAGAQLWLAQGEPIKVAPHHTTEVVDTIGAGDAFSAVMVAGLLLQWPLQETMERCQRFAASIVGTPGATVADRGFYTHFLNDWELLK